MQKRKVVAVVNNELDTRHFARQRLKYADYGVRLYDNTEDALQLIDKPADLAVLDGYNPPLGGVELFRRLRAAHRMPVIFMSGNIEAIEDQLRGDSHQPERMICVTDLRNLVGHVRDLIGPPFPPIT